MNYMTASPSGANRFGRDIVAATPTKLSHKAAGEFATSGYQGLDSIGLDINPAHIAQSATYYSSGATPSGMDSITPDVSANSVITPVQFAQSFLPGAVNTIYTIQTATALIGEQSVGRWEDEMVVWNQIEPIGDPAAYTDQGNTNLASFNNIFETQGIQRFEMGFREGRLEQARASQVRIDGAATKRQAVANAFNIQINQVGFYGWNADPTLNNQTYGILNAPGLAAYVPFVQATGDGFKDATYQEIVTAFGTMFNQLRVNSGGNIMPETQPLTVGIALSSFQFLSTQQTTLGYSPMDWLKKDFPNVRFVQVPQFDAAEGGENVMYVMADSIPDSGSDGGAIWIQPVQTRLMTLGMQQQTKGFEEAFSCATAGAVLKRPVGVARMSGI